jgi:threonine dehydrogenase-like Zn-dependent dehydrogenase
MYLSMQRAKQDNVTSMRAAVITGAGRVRIDTVSRPIPGPTQVRLRLQGCGVCASNLIPWSGPDWMHFPTAPGALGHEAWGIVDTLGSDVSDFSVGDRVASLSYNSFAEYDLAESACIVPLPEGLAERPFPGEPLGCAMNIIDRCDIQADQFVAIIGIGFLGSILTRLATERGARVIAISRRPYSLAVAEAMGAAKTILMQNHHAIVEDVKTLTGGQFCQRVIECAGSQWPLDLAGELTCERGRLIIAGYHQDGPRQVNMQLWNWRGFDVVNAHERNPAFYVAGIKKAIKAVEAGQLDLTTLCTHVFPLDKLSEALDAARDRPDGFLKAIVSFV